MFSKFFLLSFKGKLKQVVAYLLLINIIIMLGVIIGQLVIFLSTIIIALFLYYINLEIKQERFCIILDTFTFQDVFFEETQLLASKNKKLTKAYKKWLITYALENNLNIPYKLNFYKNMELLCCFCFYSIVPLFIVGIVLIIYLSLIQVWITTVILFGFSLSIFIIMENKLAKQKYKIIDSEVKRILYEEETGYSPIHKNKFTFKYRMWLLMNERKREFPFP